MEVSEVSNRLLAELLEARTGQELKPSRRWRIGSALSGLYREHGLAGPDELIALLTRSREASLARRVVEALLNNETYFFRDRAVFNQLSLQVLPMLAERRLSAVSQSGSGKSDRRLSIWSVGCSTGQEALSLAMTFKEQEARWADWTIDILGTDVSESVVAMARAGCYTQFQIQRGLGVTQMLRWFDETPDGWQAKDALRSKVRFEAHNLLDGPPSPTRFDLILCRNVLLYFEGPTRARAFERLAAALAPGGRLVLGGGETVIGQTDRFTPDTELTGVYRLAGGDDRPLATRRMSIG
ncbi:MAG: protein-glutamate O-methyltransferase CheR [Novosphingobium sp.]